MPELAAKQQVKPVICRTSTALSLHFSWHETQSCMDIRQPDALNLEYTRTMMGFLLFVPEPANIAMVGLGGGSLAKFCHRYLPKTQIRVIEINPHVIALRDELQVPPESKRFSVVLGDGAEFMRSTPERFDVLLIDGYDHEGLPAKLSSQRFYDQCSEALAPGGILVTNLYCGHQRWQQQVEKLRRSFNSAILVVDDTEGCNSIVFASETHLSVLPLAKPVRRPRTLDNEAWTQLRTTFSRVLSASRDEAS